MGLRFPSSFRICTVDIDVAEPDTPPTDLVLGPFHLLLLLHLLLLFIHLLSILGFPLLQLLDVLGEQGGKAVVAAGEEEHILDLDGAASAVFGKGFEVLRCGFWIGLRMC